MSVHLALQKLLDACPPSISYDPKVQAACTALDAEFNAVSEAIEECIILPRIAEIDDPILLEILAHQLHVDFWQDVMIGGPPSIEKQRQLILTSLEWHTYKGTKWVVEEIVRTVFSDAQVTEWFEYNAPPAPRERRYRFRVATEQSTTDPGVYARLMEAINAVKNARSWLDSIDYLLTIKGRVYVSIFNSFEIHFTVPPHG